MLNRLTISELAAKLARREVSAREAVQSCLDRIARIDGQLHAFLSHDAPTALAQAEARNGDPIAAENYYQHAEHYLRSMHESAARA